MAKGYDPYASLGFKGDRAKKRSDAAGRKRVLKKKKAAMHRLQSHPPTNTQEAKRQALSGKPMSSGAKAYAKKRADRGQPITHRGQGKTLSAKRRQEVRERNLLEMYSGRRRIAPQPKPLPKNVAGPEQPANKKVTTSNRWEQHRSRVHSQQAAKDKAKYRKTTLLGTVPILGAVTQQARKEAEGKGALASLGKNAGGTVATWFRTANPVAAVSWMGDKAGVPGAKSINKTIKNAAKDVSELPSQAIPSVYLPTKAVASDVAHGRRGEGSESRKFVKDYLDNSAVASLAQGKVKKAAKIAQEHPLITALEVKGAKSLTGRGLGASMRAVPGKSRQMAATKRNPLKIYRNIEEPRTYSKDVLTKATQVANEKRLRKKGIDPDQASPKKVERTLKRMTDEDVAAAEGNRRANRARIQEKWEGKNTPHPAAPFAAQGIGRSAKTLWNDLAAYRNHLKKVDTSEFSKVEKAAHRQTIQQVEKALKKGGDPEVVFAQVKAYKKASAPLTRELVKRTDLEPQQARMARLIPYARNSMGAKWNKELRRLEVKGKELKAGEIERHMLDNGVEIPAYVSQKPHFRGAQNFYLNFQTPKHRVAGKQRTGGATVKGAADFDPAILGEQLVRSQGIVDAVKAFDATIKTYGVRPKKGKYFKDFDEAKRWAEENSRDHDGNPIPDSLELVPVRIAPFAASKAALGKIKKGHESNDALKALADDESHAKSAADAVIESQRPGPGPVVLMPKVVMKRLREHNEVAGGTPGKAMNMASSQFKKTVLPLSPRWMLGNLSDMTIRSMLDGIGPGDIRLGRKLTKATKKIDKEAGQSLEVRALGGTQMAAVPKNVRHREATQFKGTSLEGAAKVGARVRRSPGIKQLADGYNAYAGQVFRFNTWLEKQAQYGALGKAAREQLRTTHGHWSAGVRVGPKAIEELARGLTDTQTQRMYGRYVDKVYGQWDKNSPAMRRLLIDYAPFGQWLRASTKFVLVTLPKDHPIVTGVLAGMNRMSADERERLGLDDLPPFLKGAIPTKKGLVPTAGLTSFGMFSDISSNASGMVLPQLNLEVLAGVNFKGNKIRNADGSELSPEQKFALWFYKELESFVPGLSQARRLQEGGGTSTDFSTVLTPRVKDGTKGDFKDAVDKVFNPFRPMSSNQKAASKKKKKTVRKKKSWGSSSGKSWGF